MFGFFRRFFDNPPSPAVLEPDSDIVALHEEFCRTFCHRPGVNFMDFLKANGVTRLIDWLQPSTACGLPKAFIRFAVHSIRDGKNIWEIPGISVAYEGNWDHGGQPSSESLQATSVLAQVLGKPIKIYFRERPDGNWLVMQFNP